MVSVQSSHSQVRLSLQEQALFLTLLLTLSELLGLLSVIRFPISVHSHK